MGTDGVESSLRFDRRLLGLGLYWAWLFVTFYTPVLFPGATVAADSAREAWSWAAWAHCLTLIACAVLGRRLARLANARGTAVLTGVLCMVGTGLVPLGQWLSGFGLWASWGLPVVGAVITGVATAWLVLLYGRQFARTDTLRGLQAIGGAYLMSCGIYFLVRVCDPLIAIATTTILPVASSLLLLAFGDGEVSGSRAEERSSMCVNWRVLIPLAILFFFALGGEMFRGFAVPAGEDADLGYMGDRYMAGGVVGLLVLAAAVLVRLRSPRLDGRALPGMQSVLVIMALSFLCTVLFGTSYAMGYAVFGAGFMFCRCVVWVYCAVVARRVRASAITVFGVVQASFALAVVVGVPLSQRLSQKVASGVLSWDAIAAAFLFFMVVAAVVATNKGDFESAWGLVPQARFYGVEDLSTRAVEVVRERGGVGGGPSAEPSEEPEASAPLPDLLQERFGLTSRECEVAELLAKGRSLPFVQRELVISQGTAQSHLMHIYRKMQVHSRQEFIDAIDGIAPDQA